MSISGLNNITNPNIPVSAQPISAAVTRILTLSNFSPSVKTKDLHQAFQPWAEEKGGYKIKWIDDVTALAVFNDPTIAKKAYLSMLLHPSTILPYPAVIRPYEGPDSAAIIHSVNARNQGHGRPSFSGAPSGGQSMSANRTSFGQASNTQPSFGIHAPGNVSHAAQGSINLKHARSSSLSANTMLGTDRPTFNTPNATSNASAAFNKMGGSGAFSGFGGSTNFAPAHQRNASNSSTGGSGSWGRQVATQSSAPLPPLASSSGQGTFNPGRLATHHELDSPQTTPIKQLSQQSNPSANLNTTRNEPHPLLHLPKGAGTHVDMSSPGLDILGALGPEGGPGGTPSK